MRPIEASKFTIASNRPEECCTINSVTQNKLRYTLRHLILVITKKIREDFFFACQILVLCTCSNSAEEFGSVFLKTYQVPLKFLARVTGSQTARQQDNPRTTLKICDPTSDVNRVEYSDVLTCMRHFGFEVWNKHRRVASQKCPVSSNITIIGLP